MVNIKLNSTKLYLFFLFFFFFSPPTKSNTNTLSELFPLQQGFYAFLKLSINGILQYIREQILTGSLNWAIYSKLSTTTRNTHISSGYGNCISIDPY